MAATASEPLSALLQTPALPDLGPGPRAGVDTESRLSERLREALEKMKLSAREAALVRALVLLWHDHLDAAHGIAQEIDDADGAFVHGIMHRREPDFGNARYWFRRVGEHPAFPEIAKQVQSLLQSSDASPRVSRVAADGEWDPFAFIDACERASGDEKKLLQQIQRIETQVLLKRFAAT